jgi:NTE family protein
MSIGLVLGGGGSRGIAHVGVLQVLLANDFPIDFIVGTSMGGIIGLLFALGVHPDIMIERMEAMRRNGWMNIKNLSAGGRQEQLRTILTEGLGEKVFDDLSIPTTVMAVDLISGEEIAINQGPLLEAALATSALPAVFPGVETDGKVLVDGGIIDSLSTHTAFALGAKSVIAVDLHQELDTERVWGDPISDVIGIELPFPREGQPRPIASAWRALRVMSTYIHEERLRLDPPTVLLKPDVQGYGSMDFKDIQGPYLAGIHEAERQLPELLKLTASHSDDPEI